EVRGKDRDRLPVPGSGEVDLPQPRSRHDLQPEVADLAGHGEGALPRLDGAVLVAGQPEVIREVRHHAPQPLRVGKRGGQRFRLVETLEDGPELAEGLERIAEIEAEIDRLFA